MQSSQGGGEISKGENKLLTGEYSQGRQAEAQRADRDTNRANDRRRKA